MKPGQIFSKTMPFVWAKLLLKLISVAISAVLAVILIGIGLWTKVDMIIFIMFAVWLSATGLVSFFLNHYIGYLVKAGHVAVIAEAVVTGKVPDNQVAYGKKMVQERFVTSNVYFMVDKLVSGAVRQIQRVAEKAGNMMGFIPGMDSIVKIVKMFIGIALGYIDECCLGYTFYKKDQGAFKSAADGVVIYAQNWKKLLKDAFKTTLTVIVLFVALALVALLLLGVFVRMMPEAQRGTAGFIAFLFACFIAWAIKFAFIDSYMMVKMMTSYMEAAPTTQITFDLYGKLCGWSSKFKDLWGKAQKEDPVHAYETTGTVLSEDAVVSSEADATEPAGASVAVVDAAESEKPVFCGDCGEKNAHGTKFCGSCGAKL